MKYIEKTIRPRLPREVAEKFQKGAGGGRHKNKKSDYQRRTKHRGRDEA